MDYQNIATVALEAVAAAAIPTIIYIAKGIASDFITRHFDVKKMQLELSHAGINFTSEKVSEIVNSTIENAIKALNIAPVEPVPVVEPETEVLPVGWVVGKHFIVKTNGETVAYYTPNMVGQFDFNALLEKVSPLAVKTDLSFVDYLSQ